MCQIALVQTSPVSDGPKDSPLALSATELVTIRAIRAWVVTVPSSFHVYVEVSVSSTESTTQTLVEQRRSDEEKMVGVSLAQASPLA